jgi:hypothetical protein
VDFGFVPTHGRDFASPFGRDGLLNFVFHGCSIQLWLCFFAILDFDVKTQEFGFVLHF